MDKDDKQHLKEYKEEEKSLQYRLKIMRALIDDLEYEEKAETKALDKQIDDAVDKQINEAEICVPVEHDFPNYRRYGKK